MKKICTIFLAALLSLSSLLCLPFRAEALEIACHHITEGSNEGWNNYSSTAGPIISHLTATAGGELMRFQANAAEGLYLVEYFDQKSYRYLRGVQVQEELPVYGGFYATESNYYILSGQSNYAQSPEVECYRITKYDLNWKKLGSVGLYDCNTLYPFVGGSARMTHSGKYLFIRTCHNMYLLSDGLSHQANVTIQVDTEAMRITDSATDISGLSTGYVSHSFNQFIQMEDNRIVAVDHGDAYPRSIVLTRYPTDISGGSFRGICRTTDLVTFPGKNGNNYTGASVGGFEITDSSYLVAYNAVPLDENFRKYSTRNLFVAVTDKTTGEVATRQITSYAEGEPSATTPHLVRIGEDAYLLLWTQGWDVCYRQVNGKGDPVGGIYRMKEARLSDCVPTLSGGKLIWYTWKNNVITFYEIDVKNLSKNGRTATDRREILSPATKPEGICTVRCALCGHTEGYATAERFSAFRGVDSTPSVRTDTFGCSVGSTINFNVTEVWNNSAYTTDAWTISITNLNNGETLEDDPDWLILDLHEGRDQNGYIRFTKPGRYRVRFTYLYNPSVTSGWTVTVTCDHQFGEWSSTGNEQHAHTCAVCGETAAETHKWDEGTLIEDPTGAGRDMKTFTCTVCGETKTVLASLGDLSGNGEIDATDYLLLKRFVLGTFSLTADQLAYADVNGDGQINALDYMLVKRHVLGTFRIV